MCGEMSAENEEICEILSVYSMLKAKKIMKKKENRKKTKVGINS